jgi:hypothetical protein
MPYKKVRIKKKKSLPRRIKNKLTSNSSTYYIFIVIALFLAIFVGRWILSYTLNSE